MGVLIDPPDAPGGWRPIGGWAGVGGMIPGGDGPPEQTWRVRLAGREVDGEFVLRNGAFHRVKVVQGGG